MAFTPRRLLITAGPTHEPIDDVRYLANRSSGRLGVALAQAGQAAGWEVTLLLGPVALAPPAEVRVERFETCADLEALLAQHFPETRVLIMAAAVADYRPKRAQAGKLERGARGLTLELEATPDLVAGCAQKKQPGQRIMAFALEQAEALRTRAAEKLRRKGVDAIVANPLETMNSTGIDATLLTADGVAHAMPRVHEEAGRVSKPDFACWLIAWVSARW